MTRDAAVARAAEKNRAGLADPGHGFYAAAVGPGEWSVLMRPTASGPEAVGPQPPVRAAPEPVGGEADPRRRRWPSIAAALVAGLLGVGVGLAIGSPDEAKETTITEAAQPAKTVTETESAQTVTEERTVTETVTKEAPPPPGPGPEGGGSAESDDEDGDGCSDNYDSGSCVPPYTGVDDVNCDDVGTTDIDVVGEDVYGLDGYDRDGTQDGVACES